MPGCSQAARTLNAARRCGSSCTTGPCLVNFSVTSAAGPPRTGMVSVTVSICSQPS